MTNKKIKEEFKKIWLKWNGCGQKQCEGCEYDFDFEWQEVSKLFDEARKEERERMVKEIRKMKKDLSIKDEWWGEIIVNKLLGEGQVIGS